MVKNAKKVWGRHENQLIASFKTSLKFKYVYDYLSLGLQDFEVITQVGGVGGGSFGSFLSAGFHGTLTLDLRPSIAI